MREPWGEEKERGRQSLSSLDLRIEEVKTSWEPLRKSPKGEKRPPRHKDAGKSIVHESKTEHGSSVSGRGS